MGSEQATHSPHANLLGLPFKLKLPYAWWFSKARHPACLEILPQLPSSCCTFSVEFNVHSKSPFVNLGSVSKMATLNDVLWGKQVTYTPNHPEGRSRSRCALEELSIPSAARRHSL